MGVRVPLSAPFSSMTDPAVWGHGAAAIRLPFSIPLVLVIEPVDTMSEPSQARLV